MKNGNQPINARVAFDKNGLITSDFDEYNGLTKREYFAIMALQGLLANPKQSKHTSNVFIRIAQLFFPLITLQWCSSNADDMSRDAIRQADELLKQLENQNP
jgi:hypothetical protein